MGQLETKIPVDLSCLHSWTFITSHAQVLLALADKPEASVAELAKAAEITTRSVYRVLADLQKAGYVHRRKRGTRNRYELNPELPMGDPLVKQEPVKKLFALLGEETRMEQVLASRLPGDRKREVDPFGAGERVR